MQAIAKVEDLTFLDAVDYAQTATWTVKLYSSQACIHEQIHSLSQDLKGKVERLEGGEWRFEVTTLRMYHRSSWGLGRWSLKF